jgi:twinkle protein
MDGDLIKTRLNDRAEEVCRYLLPTGKRDGSEWVCGDVAGTPGTSLRVHLDGPKAGWWADFASVDQYRGRNLLSLWMAVKNIAFLPALKEASEFLGLPQDSGWRRQGGGDKREAKKKDAAPALALGQDYVALRSGGQVWKWLTQTRKISEEVLKQYRVGESNDGKCVVFPSFCADGRLNSLKFRDITEKGRVWVLPRGAPKMLFGIQAIHEEQTELFISEGEIDAMSLSEYGFSAVSVPFGAKWPGADGNDPNTEWIKHDFEWMEKFTEVFLCLDGDEPGQKATAALVPRVGRTRCRILDYPEGKKDINECLVGGVDHDEFLKLVLSARNLDPAELLKPRDLSEDIWLEFYPDPNDKSKTGDPTPWPAIHFRFSPGELTVWHGYNGHGKTILLNHVMLRFAQNGRKSCVASLEFPAAKTFKNLMRQALGQGKPKDKVEFQEALEWMDEYFWVYAHVGETTVDNALEIFEYVAKKYGVNHFVLDSLMMLTDIGGEEYDDQKAVVLRLKEFARDFNVHVHLVAHSKKPDSKRDPSKYPPRKYDISGSANISNVADNVICVWRNTNKEENMAAAYDLMRAGKTDDADKVIEIYQPKEDARFVIQKNRETGEEIWRRLWFDKGEDGSWQYFDQDTKAAGAMRFIV